MRKWCLAVAVAALSLSGCAQIEHRSDMPEKKALAVLPQPLKITQKWQANTGEGTDQKDIQLVLAKSGASLYTVDNQGNVAAIDMATGKLQWNMTLHVPVSAGPAVLDNKLVVGTTTGKVLALDITNKKVAWQSNTTSEVLATPKLNDDMVFIHTMDGGLSALSLLDGRQLWRFTQHLPSLMLRKAGSPVVGSDQIVAGFSNGKLVGIRKQDGMVQWTQEISHPKGTTDLQRMIDISADLVTHNGRVYVASYQGNVVSLDPSNGHIQWQHAIPSYAGLVADGDYMYIAATNGDIAALDLQHYGTTYWLQNDLQGRRLTKPAVMGSYIVVADEDGVVHWLDKATGKIVGRYEVDKQGVEAPPIVNNNIVYLLGSSGRLVALEVS